MEAAAQVVALAIEQDRAASQFFGAEDDPSWYEETQDLASLHSQSSVLSRRKALWRSGNARNDKPVASFLFKAPYLKKLKENETFSSFLTEQMFYVILRINLGSKFTNLLWQEQSAPESILLRRYCQNLEQEAENEPRW